MVTTYSNQRHGTKVMRCTYFTAWTMNLLMPAAGAADYHVHKPQQLDGCVATPSQRRCGEYLCSDLRHANIHLSISELMYKSILQQYVCTLCCLLAYNLVKAAMLCQRCAICWWCGAAIAAGLYMVYIDAARQTKKHNTKQPYTTTPTTTLHHVTTATCNSHMRQPA